MPEQQNEKPRDVKPLPTRSRSFLSDAITLNGTDIFTIKSVKPPRSPPPSGNRTPSPSRQHKRRRTEPFISSDEASMPVTPHDRLNEAMIWSPTAMAKLSLGSPFREVKGGKQQGTNKLDKEASEPEMVFGRNELGYVIEPMTPYTGTRLRLALLSFA